MPGQRKAGKLNGYLRLNAKINGERQKKTKHPRERRQALVLACLYCNVYVSKLKNASRKKNSRRKTPSKGVGSKSGCKDRELFLISKILGENALFSTLSTPYFYPDCHIEKNPYPFIYHSFTSSHLICPWLTSFSAPPGRQMTIMRTLRSFTNRCHISAPRCAFTLYT